MTLSVRPGQVVHAADVQQHVKRKSGSSRSARQTALSASGRNVTARSPRKSLEAQNRLPELLTQPLRQRMVYLVTCGGERKAAACDGGSSVVTEASSSRGWRLLAGSRPVAPRRRRTRLELLLQAHDRA